MKFSLFALPFLSILSVSAASSPDAGAAVVKRQTDYAPYAAIIQGLTAQVIEVNKQINATLASVSPNADPLTKSAASLQVNAGVQRLTDLVNAATQQVQATAANAGTGDQAGVVAKRQIDVGVLAAAIVVLLVEISSTLNGIIAVLGLSGLLAFASPLTLGLSGLILALDVVVTGLLVAVGVLVNGLLIGLSIALAGLIV